MTENSFHLRRQIVDRGRQQPFEMASGAFLFREGRAMVLNRIIQKSDSLKTDVVIGHVCPNAHCGLVTIGNFIRADPCAAAHHNGNACDSGSFPAGDGDPGT
jgi:hypothetical protein